MINTSSVYVEPNFYAPRADSEQQIPIPAKLDACVAAADRAGRRMDAERPQSRPSDWTERTTMGSKAEVSKYNAEAVQKEINKDKRIGDKEAKLIHSLLKGRADANEPVRCDADTLFRAGDMVVATTTAQGLVKGQKYEITDVLSRSMGMFGTFVTYTIKGVGQIGNGHLLLRRA